MDPLSITAAVLGITTKCFSAAKALNDIRNAFQNAPVTLTSLCSETTIIAASLSRIQSLLLQDVAVTSNTFATRREVRETFDSTLTSCVVIGSCLEEHVKNITRHILAGKKSNWKARFKTVWNADEIEQLLGQIRGQQLAINLLISLLQMDSLSEIHRTVMRNEKLLQKIIANSQSLRRSHSVKAPSSIFEGQASNASILDERNFTKAFGKTNEADDDFEAELFRSSAYKRSVAGLLAPLTEDKPDDTRTITAEEASPDNSTAPINAIGNLHIRALPGNTSSVTRPFQEIIDWKKSYAWVYGNYKPTNPTELRLKFDHIIVNLWLESDGWIGQVKSGSSLTPSGRFHRENVHLFFVVKGRILAVARQDIFSEKGLLSAPKGSRIAITEICHGGWFVCSYNGVDIGFVDVEFLHIDEKGRANIDGILSTFRVLDPNPRDVASLEGCWREIYRRYPARNDQDKKSRKDETNLIFSKCGSVEEIIELLKIWDQVRFEWEREQDI
ncbi:hypothetical protein P154DRAFT_619347 [Amniculicola lignicola CBS 123094]|uniref:Fungal N-terminal domain-containing protein n=1 Tax=Amniculicola lignicola CBS 123094 TaxID=1392246 RepID=A0A6A5WK47_9PLEO|nr:hypothetical protein P154DRAFT_619347 [Amniculicola lignicola CBS 123094]